MRADDANYRLVLQAIVKYGPPEASCLLIVQSSVNNKPPIVVFQKVEIDVIQRSSHGHGEPSNAGSDRANSSFGRMLLKRKAQIALLIGLVRNLPHGVGFWDSRATSRTKATATTQLHIIGVRVTFTSARNWGISFRPTVQHGWIGDADMQMNVRPVPTLDDEVNEVRLSTAEIINNHILPYEDKLWARRLDGSSPSHEAQTEAAELRRNVQNEVKKAKLWAPHLPPEFGGMGLSFMQHAYMNEVLAYAPGAASLFGVVAPNSGNQKILVKYGTPEQHQKWLLPLTEGRMQSGFSMTEPMNPGSDPRSLTTRAVLDGDEWVINGHKWFTSNGHAADFYIVMCRTADPDDPSGANEKMTQIIVPRKTPGVNIIRGVPVWGKRSSHCEIKYEDVRVPKENQLGQTGTGHQAAQDRLGAGRIYHCMNSVGAMWRCFDLMVDRIIKRKVHGGETLEHKQFMQGFIADSYMDIQSSRLMVVDCAQKMEAGADSRTDISSIKVYVPAAYHRVVDRAIQVYGAAGVSGDYPFADMYTGARTLRIADGPDEVHKILIAKNVLRRYHAGESWDFGN